MKDGTADRGAAADVACIQTPFPPEYARFLVRCPWRWKGKEGETRSNSTAVISMSRGGGSGMFIKHERLDQTQVWRFSNTSKHSLFPHFSCPESTCFHQYRVRLTGANGVHVRNLACLPRGHGDEPPSQTLPETPQERPTSCDATA